MKFMDTLKRSGRNLRQAKVRTFLTASAIAVGGFTLTLTLGAATGARAYSEHLISANFNPNSVLVAKDRSMFGEANNNGPQEYAEDLGVSYGTLVKQLSRKDIDNIKKVQGVKDVIEGYETNAQFITRQGAKRYTGSLGVYDSGQKPEMKAGVAPEKLADGQVIMPEVYVPLLHFSSAEDAIGKNITVQVRQVTGDAKAFTFKVAGVTKKSTFQIDFAPAGLFLSQNDARAANNFVNAGTLSEGKLPIASVITDGKPEEIKKALEKAGYVAMTAKDAQEFLYKIINVLQIIILVFGFVTLIASFFGVVNTQYISVLERTREVGLMKALGMSKRSVSRLFIIEATWIGFLGAVFGSLLALLAGKLLNPVITDKLDLGKETLLIFEPLQIIGLIAFLMLVTTVAGLLPARKAAKLDPIEALRTE